MDWIQLAEDWDKRWAVVNAVMNSQLLKKRLCCMDLV